jgi:hypothetical protein
VQLSSSNDPTAIHVRADIDFDFAPVRVLVPGPNGFPPAEAEPGAIGSPGYSPLVELPGGVVVKAHLPQRATSMTDLATAYAHLPEPEVEHACDLLSHAHAIAAPAGLGEAMRRVMEARHHLQQWASSPSVQRLDERLRPI